MRVLVIGGNSRLARAFSRHASPDIQCRIVVRAVEVSQEQADTVRVDSYAELPDSAFVGVTAVINCVGAMTPSQGGGTLADVNVLVPVHAARQAREAGVKHFVQVSSVYVYGETEHIDQDTAAIPDTPYGQSKLDADEAVSGLRQDGFTVTILRIPILYGGGSHNRLLSLARLMMRARFFVTPSTIPERSILHLDNAAAILKAVLERRPDRIVLAADEHAFTFATLAEAIERNLNRRVHLIGMPDCLLAPLRYTLKSTYQRLFSSRLVTRDELVASLTLPVTMEQGLADLLSGQ